MVGTQQMFVELMKECEMDGVQLLGWTCSQKLQTRGSASFPNPVESCLYPRVLASTAFPALHALWPEYTHVPVL